MKSSFAISLLCLWSLSIQCDGLFIFSRQFYKKASRCKGVSIVKERHSLSSSSKCVSTMTRLEYKTEKDVDVGGIIEGEDDAGRVNFRVVKDIVRNQGEGVIGGEMVNQYPFVASQSIFVPYSQDFCILDPPSLPPAGIGRTTHGLTSTSTHQSSTSVLSSELVSSVLES